MMILYAEAVLSIYSSLEDIIYEIDNIVLKRALNSMDDCSPALTQCERVIDLIKEKDLLINLFLSADKAIFSFENDDRVLLEYKYFRSCEKERYAYIDYKSRAYFRRQNALLEKFSKKMNKLGFTDEYFEKHYLTIDFIKNTVKKIIRKSIKEVNVKKEKPHYAEKKISA